MNFKRWRLWAYSPLLIWLTLVHVGAGDATAHSRTEVVRPKSAAVEFITVEELKSKITKAERVTIIDVRSSAAFNGSDKKIKGAIHVKLRRLKSRLAFAPLKDVPRDAEVVTYCACPSDESSMRAAEVLREAGFKRVRVLKGGWEGWQKVGGQVELRPKTP